MLSLILMLTLLGCDTKIEDTADGITTREEEPVPESDPEPWGYEPDMVIFHNVTIVDGSTIGCFDDGDGTPYCGVHKIYLTVFDEWGGLGDQAGRQGDVSGLRDLKGFGSLNFIMEQVSITRMMYGCS